ncbi:MAG: RAMP superfamily CRISPR-associated protein [Syntrophales bacterium]
MSFDYFAEINEKLFSLLKPIVDIDEQIENKKGNIKELKQKSADKTVLLKVEQEKKALENERKKLWKIKWDEAYKFTPYFGSHWKLLSSAYFEDRKPFNEILRRRYIELQFQHGQEKIKEGVNTAVISELIKILETPHPQIDIDIFPPYSLFLQFKFTLATPYLSKDDDQFYICENPIRKDKVFKVPMVSASTWKGNLRWTARQIGGLNTEEIIRLFGNEKREEREFRRGRLNFFPTFFDRIGLEVINPHDRKTKAGIQPIYIESVPEGGSGTFTLLYVPFDLMGKQENEVKEQVKKDMDTVSDSLKEMMLTYGFSAKKSSGFGIIENNFKIGTSGGQFIINGISLSNNQFDNFSGLATIIEELKSKL